ncbi:hypothetical protein B0O99DRAFT_693912 [Bisporella sp. PMI_857]|nr:hypothetical protein B0O99DRAFT_693912 [Bisporella sp. PMI_857]
MKSLEDKTGLLEDYEEGSSRAGICTHCQNSFTWKRSLSSCLRLFFILEMSQIAVITLGYGIWTLSHHHYGNSELDKYFGLDTYNTTQNFHGISKAAEHSAQADHIWKKIRDFHGVVALDAVRAKKSGLATATPHPYDNNFNIYQVDVFHSLHCLWRIRERLISPDPLDELQRDDKHTLHCVDYIREELQCHSDITLQGSDEYIKFQNNNGHQCHDFEDVTK